jgi:hypothetical protein
MFTKTKMALSAAIVLSTALTASAATKPRVASDNGLASYSVIPGYDKDGRVIEIPNPDQFGSQANR